MGLPKRKHSRSRSRKNRTHYKVSSPGLSVCQSCGEHRPPHRACPSCGFHKGKTYIKEKQEENS
ncbi:MAG TPA: 50S ribosomal protein L32 [Thermodesulfobacteriota bacterium]|nr:50S ribosomal protein L32 [Thermodesulfobacteriota bacterium]